MDNDEKKKIREIMSKKDESRVDWMYKASQPDTKDYLLGRKIDKHIEKVPEPTQEEKIGAAFSERIKANIELDMAAKMREDPLFQIRKREDEARRRILDNPVKMKQIQKMINDKKDHQKSKRKKSKKEKKSRSRDDSDSDQSGDDLMNTYLNIINKKHQDKSDGDKRHHQEDRRRPGYGLQKHSRDREEKHSRDREEKHSRDREEQHSFRRDHHSKSFQHESSRNSNSSERTSKYSSSSSQGKSSNSHSYHRQSNYRRRSQSRSPRRSRSRSPHHSRSRSPRHSGSRSPRARGKLNETEREKKLREMMDNAKWREEVRQKNVKRYEEECAEDERNAQKGNSADFLNPMMSQHAAQSSVEERIKRNKYNIQRTKMQLNSNFNKR